MKSKAKVKPLKSMHAYRVSYHQFDETKVERFKITASTDTKVTYVNDYGVEFTSDKISYAYRWFKTKERAKAFALKKLKHRISFYGDVIKRLEKQIQKL